MEIQMVVTVLLGSVFIIAAWTHDPSKEPSACRHLREKQKLYHVEIATNEDTVSLGKHATTELKCQNSSLLVRLDVHRIGKRFHATIQTCKNVMKILLWLKSASYFRATTDYRRTFSCNRRHDAMLLVQPKRRQVVTIVPSSHTDPAPLSLMWTYQYLTNRNTTRWAYMDSLSEPGTKARSDGLMARGKRSNEVDLKEPVIQQYQSECEKDLSCVRFGAQRCGHLECDYLLTYSITNNTLLELEISGKVNGWVALGLSSDNKMGGDDVIVCKRKSKLGPDLEVLSMWTRFPHTRPEAKRENKLQLITQEVKDGYIYCKITTTNQNTESHTSLDLTKDWYQLYAMGDIDKDGNMLQHNQMPPTSSSSISMLKPFYTHSSRYQQLKVHSEPIIQQHQPVCGKDLSCVRFGAEGCGHLECDYLLTYSITNHTFLELEISGNVNGWVALGLSSDNKMGGNDVIACKRKCVLGPDLEAASMWVYLPHTRPEAKTENKLNLVSQRIKDGYIYCKITRIIDTKDTGSDTSLDLTNNWYQLYAKGEIDKGGSMLQHSQTPPTSLRTITMLRPFYTHSSRYQKLKNGASNFRCLASSVLALAIALVMWNG